MCIPSLEGSYHARSVKVVKCKLLTTQIGVICCVSYSRTVSCVATAYIIRYGNTKAGFGPNVDAPVSKFRDLDGVVTFSGSDPAAEVGGGGGGSMTEGAGDGLEMGSGSAGIGSSAEDVSMVICFVTCGVCRSV